MIFIQKGVYNFTLLCNVIHFVKLIEGKHRFTVVFFAPGACRYDAARQPIPGGNDRTKGWSLEKYREFVKEHQGDTISIVETLEESQIIPLLAQVLADADVMQSEL